MIHAAGWLRVSDVFFAADSAPESNPKNHGQSLAPPLVAHRGVLPCRLDARPESLHRWQPRHLVEDAGGVVSREDWCGGDCKEEGGKVT